MSERVLILTVGTGPGIAKALAVHGIDRQNPDRVILLATSRSARENVPILREHVSPRFLERIDEPYVFDDFDNVERLFEQYLETIEKEVLDKGIPPKEVHVNFTSGTKAMSSALVAAATTLGLGQVHVIKGTRDSDTGRVIEGTEELQMLSPRSFQLRQGLDQFTSLFDQAYYPAASEVVQRLQERHLDAKNPEQIALFARVASFYAAWDRQDLDAALAEDTKLDDEQLEQAKDHLPTAFADAVYQHTKKVLGIMANADYHAYRLADLLENAERRYQQGAFADAMMRLYRATEYLAQHRLYHAHDKIETKDLDLSKLPDALQPTYADMGPATDTINLSMLNAYRLLHDLDDELGTAFMTAYNKKKSDLKRLLNKRNNSILAHGFQPVAEEDVALLRDQFVVPLAEEYIPKFAEFRSHVRFPTFE
ncbi:MAG: TIGR02710 family CRISPR-associated protein [Bacteroidetes bacterium]|jgi:CRISPR-associated protein (TIGR02710 family)|nr:TIGR02710 family CRISPR-associated protein [Bacteroidota bacterium]